LSFDLPHEGAAQLACDATDRDVATCRDDELVRDIVARIDGGHCVVLNEQQVVMGVVSTDGRELVTDARVEDVMRFGVSTVRPSEDLQALIERMQRRDVDSLVVTRSDAALVGLLDRRHAEHMLATRDADGDGRPSSQA
jgi:predicted transcriptional regulator